MHSFLLLGTAKTPAKDNLAITARRALYKALTGIKCQKNTCLVAIGLDRVVLDDARRHHRIVAHHLTVFDPAGAASVLQHAAGARSVFFVRPDSVGGRGHRACSCWRYGAGNA